MPEPVSQPPERKGSRLSRLTRRVLLVAGIASALVVLWIVQDLHAGRQVYFVPLEAEPELVESLRIYYRDQLGLNVIILPSLQFTSNTSNEQRHQVTAERVIELMNDSYPQIRWPRPAIAIGITSRDLYIEDRPWNFAFSWREAPRAAIVSYRRMDPQYFGRRPDPRLLEARLRKMVTRNIGVLGYGLPMTVDRFDLMYQDVLGLDDLDTIIEDLPRAGFPVAPAKQPVLNLRAL